MTPLQALDKYVDYAQALEWGSGSPTRSGKIFNAYGGVKKSVGFPREHLAKLTDPALILSPGEYRAHPEYPGIGDFFIGATIFTAKHQDPFGSDAIDYLLEIFWAWIESIQAKGQANGIEVVGFVVSAPVPVVVDGTSPMMRLDIRVQTRIGAYAAADYT